MSNDTDAIPTVTDSDNDVGQLDPPERVVVTQENRRLVACLLTIATIAAHRDFNSDRQPRDVDYESTVRVFARQERNRAPIEESDVLLAQGRIGAAQSVGSAPGPALAAAVDAHATVAPLRNSAVNNNSAGLCSGGATSIDC